MKMVIRIAAVVAFLSAVAVYNLLLVDVRFEELYSLLGSSAARDEALTTFGILSKYESVIGGASADDDPCSVDHGRAIGVLLSEPSAGGSPGGFDYHLPVRYVVSGIRLLLGKDVIRPYQDDQIVEVLKIGYFFERNGRYKAALKVYNDVLKTAGVDGSVRVAVMMHDAFCISMLGNLRNAKLIYEQVINQYSSTGAGALSWKLLDCIEAMEQKRKAIEAQGTTALEKARAFVAVMDFQSAGMYAALAESSIRPGTAAEVHYCKGRSFEGLSMGSEAEREYRFVKRSDGRSAWAGMAACRLTAMQEFDAGEKKLAAEAQRRLAVYRDLKFSEKVRAYAQDVSQNMLRNELMNGGPGASPDSLLNALLNLSETDLTGGTSAADQQRKLDSMRNALVEKSDETGTTAGRQKHTLRRPTAIKAVIDGHRSELTALYKKRLQSRVRLSGKILVELTIRENGSVGGLSIVQSDLGDQIFERQVLKSLQTWRFRPVPAGTGSLTIRYPFEFP